MTASHRALDRYTKPAILVVHPSDELYGADHVLLTVLDAIRARVQPVVVLPSDTSPGLLSDALAARGIPVTRVNLPIIRRRYLNPVGVLKLAILTPFAVAALVRLGRRHRVVAIHTNTAVVLGAAIPAWILGAAHVWHIHEIVQSRLLARVVALLTRLRTRRVVAISNAVRSRLVADGGRVTDVYWNPAPPWRPRPENDGPPIVTIVGRINGAKGHHEFVMASELIHATHPEAHFRVIGGSVPERAEAYEDVRKRSVALDPTGAWLEFVGWSGDIESELVRATVVALPSTVAEGLNITALEAMAVGRAIVATAVGGLPEVVTDGETGLLIPPGDSRALAAAIRRLLDDPALRAALVAGGHARIRAQFDLRVYGSSWDALYKDIVGDRLEHHVASLRVTK